MRLFLPGLHFFFWGFLGSSLFLVMLDDEEEKGTWMTLQGWELARNFRVWDCARMVSPGIAMVE